MNIQKYHIEAETKFKNGRLLQIDDILYINILVNEYDCVDYRAMLTMILTPYGVTSPQWVEKKTPFWVE